MPTVYEEVELLNLAAHVRKFHVYCNSMMFPCHVFPKLEKEPISHACLVMFSSIDEFLAVMTLDRLEISSPSHNLMQHSERFLFSPRPWKHLLHITATHTQLKASSS